MSETTELREAADALLAAAATYHAAANRHGIFGAVIWLEGTGGDLVIVTRGEYRETLMAGIRETTPRTLAFGVGGT